MRYVKFVLIWVLLVVTLSVALGMLGGIGTVELLLITVLALGGALLVARPWSSRQRGAQN